MTTKKRTDPILDFFKQEKYLEQIDAMRANLSILLSKLPSCWKYTQETGVELSYRDLNIIAYYLQKSLGCLNECGDVLEELLND